MGQLFRYFGPLALWVVIATLLAIAVIVVSGSWRPLRPWGSVIAFAPLVISMISQQLAIRQAISTCHAIAIFNLDIVDELFEPVGRPDIYGASLTAFCLLLNWIVGRRIRARYPIQKQ